MAKKEIIVLAIDMNGRDELNSFHITTCLKKFVKMGFLQFDQEKSPTTIGYVKYRHSILMSI